MTPREMTSEEVESILAAMRRIGMRVEAETLRAHIAALRARAEVAEADAGQLARLLADAVACSQFSDNHNPACANRTWPPGDCDCWRAQSSTALRGSPGTGYRAKVRAELLRELAEQHADAARLLPVEKHQRGALHEELSENYARQAAREEQG